MAYLIHAEKEKILSGRAVIAHRCERCQKNNTTYLYAILKYVTFYWIPFAPDKIYIKAECTNCSLEYFYDSMPTRLQQDSDDFKKENKFPLWCFTGFGIIIVLVGCLLIFFHFQDQDTKKYINEPRVNDKFEVKIKGKSFFDNDSGTYMRIVAVTKYNVVFLCNNKMVESGKTLSDIDKPENYTSKLQTYSKIKLIKMEDEGVITKISREE